MTTVAFSSLSSLSAERFLALSKRYAKTIKKADPAARPLHWHQDQIAIGLGFENWALLHKQFTTNNWSVMAKVLARALKSPGLGTFIRDHSAPSVGGRAGGQGHDELLEQTTRP